jgi:hypothetical protein
MSKILRRAMVSLALLSAMSLAAPTFADDHDRDRHDHREHVRHVRHDDHGRYAYAPGYVYAPPPVVYAPPPPPAGLNIVIPLQFR